MKRIAVVLKETEKDIKGKVVRDEYIIHCIGIIPTTFTKQIIKAIESEETVTRVDFLSFEGEKLNDNLIADYIREKSIEVGEITLDSGNKKYVEPVSVWEVFHKSSLN